MAVAASTDPRASRWWAPLRRTDPVPLLCGALSLLLTAVFVGVSLRYNGGHLVPPLDDVYIHMQYARQVGSGEPFRYLPGEPVSTGASSVLYVVLLGIAYAVGFHGLLGFAVFFGAVCIAVATAFTAVLGRELAGRTAGIWAGALTAVSGPLLWGAASGMEVGLLALLLTGSVLAFVRERPTARFLVTPLAGVLLALTRPEGLITAAALVAAMLWTLGRAAVAGRLLRPDAVRSAGLALLPLVAGAGQAAVQYLATGTSEANGVQAKSWLHEGLLRQPLEVADHTLHNVQAIVAGLSGISGQDVLPPGTLAFAVLGLVALGLRRQRTLAVALGAALAGVLLGVGTLTTAQWQDLRYLQPFLPLFVLLAVLGVAALAELAGPERGRLVLHGVLGVGLLFTLLATPTWALRLGQQASAMREGPVSVARWIATHVPPGEVVAVNDVGAAAWFGGHRTVDLVGLTTNGLAAPSRNGPGTLYDALRRLPPQDRPGWFAIFDRWGGAPVSDLGRSGLLGTQPVTTFQLVAPPRPISPAAPQTCQIDLDCDRVSIWRADWTVTGDPERPDLPVPGTLRDHVGVGDMADETAHGWAPAPPVLGLQPLSTLDRAPAPDRMVADAGRRVVGGESFTLRGLTPGRPVTLTGRLGADAPVEGDRTRALVVEADGREAGTWVLPRATPWRQSSFVLPGELVTGPEVRVTTRPEQPFLAPYPDYRSYEWWAHQ
ncbi:hypothetical protein [Pseudonocardia phyllosphaerae]|uniref:hypothetical protein n=1 Tax=Pseudonocardia phyllosphaerae TaxID=3390502 RepID=UPI0039784257